MKVSNVFVNNGMVQLFVAEDLDFRDLLVQNSEDNDTFIGDESEVTLYISERIEEGYNPEDFKVSILQPVNTNVNILAKAKVEMGDSEAHVEDSEYIVYYDGEEVDRAASKHEVKEIVKEFFDDDPEADEDKLDIQKVVTYATDFDLDIEREYPVSLTATGHQVRTPLNVLLDKLNLKDYLETHQLLKLTGELQAELSKRMHGQPILWGSGNVLVGEEAARPAIVETPMSEAKSIINEEVDVTREFL